MFFLYLICMRNLTVNLHRVKVLFESGQLDSFYNTIRWELVWALSWTSLLEYESVTWREYYASLEDKLEKEKEWLEDEFSDYYYATGYIWEEMIWFARINMYDDTLEFFPEKSDSFIIKQAYRWKYLSTQFAKTIIEHLKGESFSYIDVFSPSERQLHAIDSLQDSHIIQGYKRLSEDEVDMWLFSDDEISLCMNTDSVAYRRPYRCYF